MRHTKTFEKFEITEGPEKGNQKFVTSDRPKIAPAPQAIRRHDDDEIDKKFIITTVLVRLQQIMTIFENADASGIDGTKISNDELFLIKKLLHELDNFDSQTEL